MTLHPRAFRDAYLEHANHAQRALDFLSFACGALTALQDEGAEEGLDEWRDVVHEQLQALRLAVDDLDVVIATEIFGAARLGGRCTISEVRPTGMAQCTLPLGHAGEHNFPA